MFAWVIIWTFQIFSHDFLSIKEMFIFGSTKHKQCLRKIQKVKKNYFVGMNAKIQLSLSVRNPSLLSFWLVVP